MYLQKLEIQGFKSFAAKTTIIFPKEKEGAKGITAVVGPNGSGKSNIADAIRWVMGEQSMKLLRSKHSEDVIFFGSDKKSQLGYCEVSLYFNNEDKTFPIDFPEAVITRRLYRTGESEYCINKNKVRLSDVTLLLAQAQFGQRSYSVIGQGMIDHIIQMPAGERKEFFIEAAGVRQYHIKKESALHKVKATKDNLHHMQAMLGELEPKLKFLGRQMKRLEQREELEKKLFELQKHYFHTLWWTLEEQRNHTKEAHHALLQEIAVREKKLQALQETFHTIEQSDVTQHTGDFSHLQKQYEQAVAKKNCIIAEISVIDARMRVEYEQSGDVHIPWLMKRKTELQQTLNAYQAELTMLSSDHERYEEEEKKYVSQLQSLDDAIQDIQKKRKEHFTSPSSITHEDVLRALEMIYAKKEAYEVLQTHQLLQDQVYGLFEMVFSLIQKIKATLVAHKKESDPRDSLGDMENLFSQKDALRSQFQSIQTAHGIQKERIGTVHSALQKHTEELATCERDLLYFSSQAGKKKDDMLQKEREALSMALTNTEKTLQDFQHTMHARYTQEKESRTRLVNIQKEMAVHQRGMEHIQQSQNATQLELARIETHQEELIRKIADELHVHDTECVSLLGFATPPQELHVEEARLDIEKYKRALEQIGTIDQEIITEHTATKERYDFLTKQMEDLIAALGNLERAIQELDAIIKEKFNVSLDGINKKFQEYFQTLFRGGNAHIIIQKQEQETVLPRTQEDVEQEKEGVEETDKEDDVSGIDIHATPPGKKLKNMSVLSGGEKALTAISLLCAILSINPSPFVVLDEVDAALDESNAGRLASILQELSRKTQFIVITHNRVTTHIAQVLYGITMGEDGTSRMLSLDIGNIDAIVPAS